MLISQADVGERFYPDLEPKRVLLFAENASMNMSGEAALALYYFDRLRERNHDVWLVCHSRVKLELSLRYPRDVYSRIHFVQDSPLQKAIYSLSRWLPPQIRDSLVGALLHIITQMNARPIIQKIIQDKAIDLVFSPSVISPKAPSCLYDLKVPVVIGPMCGGIDFPPCFQDLESIATRLLVYLGRSAADLLNRVFPGKLQAAALLVANHQTARALPSNCTGKIYEVVESGVDLSIWQPTRASHKPADHPVRFVYMARFVDQKGISFLIEAFKRVAEQSNVTLDLIGSGELFDSIKARVSQFNLEHRVMFHGWMALEDAAQLIRQCDVYLVPAIRDCGGCAMLEAMAMGLPVIAANWAGPGAYLDTKSGIRVDVPSREAFIQGLADAMLRLAESSFLREQFGKGSLARVQENYFDWDRKVDRIAEIFQDVLLEANQASTAIASPVYSLQLN